MRIPRHCLVEAHDRRLLCRENPIDDPSTPAWKWAHHGWKFLDFDKHFCSRFQKVTQIGSLWRLTRPLRFRIAFPDVLVQGPDARGTSIHADLAGGSACQGVHSKFSASAPISTGRLFSIENPKIHEHAPFSLWRFPFQVPTRHAGKAGKFHLSMGLTCCILSCARLRLKVAFVILLTGTSACGFADWFWWVLFLKMYDELGFCNLWYSKPLLLLGYVLNQISNN